MAHSTSTHTRIDSQSSGGGLWSFTHRLRWIHLIPVILICTCLGSVYLLTYKLAHEISTAQVQQQKQDLLQRQLLESHTNSESLVSDLNEFTVERIEPEPLSLPHSFDEACDLSLQLSSHLRSHPSSRMYLILLFASIYLLKQTFSIPGSVLLNIMCGYIFGSWIGVPLVACLTAIGASGCYWLSHLIGAELIRGCASIQNRMQGLQKLIDHEKLHGNLFVYLLIIRIFPFTPNWFINLAAPLVGIPFHLFFASCLCGLLPYVYITVTAGDTLHTFTLLQQSAHAADGSPTASVPMSLSDVMDSWTIIKLILLATSLLLPTLLKRYVDRKTDATNKKELQFKF